MAVAEATVEKEVAYFLGYGYNQPDGDVGDLTLSIAERAMYNFLVPAVLQGEAAAHRWSWLSSTGDVLLNAPVTFSHSSAAGYKLFDNTPGSEVAPSVTAGVVNFGLETIANFPQFVFTHSSGDGSSGADQVTAIVEVSGLGAADGYHFPTSFTFDNTDGFRMTLADTSITVAETGTGVSFTFYHVMHAAGTGFDSVDGYMNHAINSGHPHIEMINLGALRDLYAGSPVTSDTPSYVAYDDAKSRFLFWPPADKSYVIKYKYDKSQALTTIPDKYMGIIVNGALAIAEGYADTPNSGKFQKLYDTQLKSAVLDDRSTFREEYFGVNEDRSDRVMPYGRKTDRSDIYYTNRSGTKFPS